MPLGQCAILLWPRAASFEPAAAGRVAQRTGPLCVKVAEHAGFEPAGRLRDHGLASRCLGPLGQCSCITSYGYCVKATKNQAAGAAYPLKNLAPREGLEPSTIGFGGRCAANCATEMQKNWQGRQDSNGQPTGSKPAAPPLRDSPITWSGWVDSNHRPLASKARALTRLRYIQKNCPFKNWCPRGESNSQNPASKASMSASSITGALPQLMLRPQTHFGCVLTRPAPWRGQVSLHKGANPCTSSPGACALIERAVVQRHTRSEAAVWRCPPTKSDHRPGH